MTKTARQARIAARLQLTPRFKAVSENFDSLRQMDLRFYLSPELKLAYVKNHKAGSTSIIANLSHISEQKLDGSVLDNYRAVHNQRPKGFYSPRALGYTESDKFLDDDEVFVFTAAREPLKRTVSAYVDKFVKRADERRAINRSLGFEPKKRWTISDFFERILEDEEFRDSNMHWRFQRKEISYDHIPYDCIAPLNQVSLLQDMVFMHVLGEQIPRVDARKMMGHRTKSDAFVNELPRPTIQKFREVYREDYDMLSEINSAWKDQSKAFHILLGHS